VNVHDNKIWKKRVRPVAKQGEFESRKLWQHVTNALRVGDINTATDHKKFVSSFTILTTQVFQDGKHLTSTWINKNVRNHTK